MTDSSQKRVRGYFLLLCGVAWLAGTEFGRDNVVCGWPCLRRRGGWRFGARGRQYHLGGSGCGLSVFVYHALEVRKTRRLPCRERLGGRAGGLLGRVPVLPSRGCGSGRRSGGRACGGGRGLVCIETVYTRSGRGSRRAWALRCLGRF